MHGTRLLCGLIGLGVVSAAWQQLLPDSGAMALHARQTGDCTTESTCAQCFGEGSVICDNIGCFTPDKHEQCCVGAYICVGQDNSCCSDLGGPGVTGTAGVPNATAASIALTATTSQATWSCNRLQSGEQCCQGAPIPLHWCSGEFPDQRCYNPANQFCCTDGTVCDEKDCCTLFNASTTNPYLATLTAPATAGSTTRAAPSNNTSSSSTSAAQSTTTKSNAASSTKSGVVLMGVCILDLIVLYAWI